EGGVPPRIGRDVVERRLGAGQDRRRFPSPGRWHRCDACRSRPAKWERRAKLREGASGDRPCCTGFERGARNVDPPDRFTLRAATDAQAAVIGAALEVPEQVEEVAAIITRGGNRDGLAIG